jgi:aspartate/methionine/tyrosine aminotransferase
MPTTTPALELNPRVAAMQPSATLAMSGRAKALKREGRPVIALSAGEPDFDTPAPIREAGIRAIEEGHTHYTANPGTPELREAIVQKLRADNGLDYAPEDILCSNGAKQSVAQAVFVLCRPGDEVVIPAPYWVSYPEMARLAGAEPVVVEAAPEDGYRMTPEDLDAALGERSRVLLLNSPSNPTGAVYSHAELEALADVLRAYPDVVVISDEIYEHVVYDAEHVAFASIEGMKDRTVTVNGFSKAYAMTGWRLGYFAAPRWITSAAAKMQGQFTSAPCSITQQAGVAALGMDREPVRQMVRAFRERRDFVLSALARLPGVECPTPEGAFYVFPDVSSYFGTTAPSGRAIEGSEDLCFYLLEEHDVALVPGDAFGAPYGVRLSYAASMEDLRTAMKRIEAGLAALDRE